MEDKVMFLRPDELNHRQLLSPATGFPDDEVVERVSIGTNRILEDQQLSRYNKERVSLG